MAKVEPGTYHAWCPADVFVGRGRPVNLGGNMDNGLELLETDGVAEDWATGYCSNLGDYGLGHTGHSAPPSWTVPIVGYGTVPPSAEPLQDSARQMVPPTGIDLEGCVVNVDRGKAGDADYWSRGYYHESSTGGRSATVGGMVSSPTSSGAGSGGEGRDSQNRPGVPKAPRITKGAGNEAEKDIKPHINRSQDTQRRYRERQKQKAHDLQERNKALTENSKILFDENRHLKSQVQTLLSVIQVNGLQVPGPGQHHFVQQPHIQNRPQIVGAGQHQQNPSAASRSLSQAHSQAADGDELADLVSSLTLTVKDPPICLTSGQLEKLSHPDLSVLWKEYINILARLLVTVDPVKGAPAGLVDRIDQLTQEALALLTKVSFPNPLGVKTFVATKLEDDMVSRDEGCDWWHDAVDKLRLSSEQKGAASSLRKSYLEQLNTVLVDRQDLFTKLLSSQPSTLSTRVTAAHYLQADGLLHKLRLSMDQENKLVCNFITSLYQILTPIQRAQYVVQAWPWTPDHLAFCTAVAAQLGDTGAQALLNGGPPAGSNRFAMLLKSLGNTDEIGSHASIDSAVQFCPQ